MSADEETPWGHVQKHFAARRPFEDALEGLQAHGLSGEDIGVLFNNPSSELVTWMQAGAGGDAVALSPVEPPAGAALPEQRGGKRGLFGWLAGKNAIEGLGLFTESDVFELNGVQFSVLPEPIRSIAYGELVAIRVLVLNCTAADLPLSIVIEAERGVVQSPRHYVLALEPGIISLAVLPVRVCPTSEAVVPIFPTFEVDGEGGSRHWKFSARPYAKPNELMSLLAGASFVAAAAGLSPVYLRTRGPSDQGSPDPIKVRPDLKKPLVAPWQEPTLWRLLSLASR